LLNQTNPEKANSHTPMAQVGTPEVGEPEFTSSTDQGGQSSDVFLLKPEEVEDFWPLVVDHLQKAVPHSEGEVLPEDMLPSLVMGDMQLWFAVEEKKITAAMVTQIIPYPRKKILRILSIGGEGFSRWYKHMPKVEMFAKTVGCSGIEAWGRKGWLKALPDWKCSYHILTKEISDG
tara:strand:- start:857 stop:1384 length:528 start_codon:yes stop_codon:yes gene_type:complete